jgi:hypothetical protein
MPIANYTTDVSVAATAGEVQALLAKAGARRIMTEFAQGTGGASIVAMSFEIETETGPRGFTLPIRTEGVLATLKRDKAATKYLTMAHAEKVAWRIAAAWLKSQLALIDAGMTTLDEVMFPWMLTGPEDKPAYEAFRDTQKAIAS